MARVKSKTFFHTPAEVADILDSAVRAVEASEVPPELHEVAFAEAVRLLGSAQVELEAFGSGLLAATLPGR